MAVTGLITNKQSHTDFFHRRILLNAQYWRDYVGDNAGDISALDCERDRVVKAITFALDLTEAWPSGYDLLVNFATYMERRGHWEISNHLLNRAIKMAQQVEDVTGLITLSALLARLLQRQSQPDQAVRHYRRVIRWAGQSKNLYEEARACTNLGYLYIEKGHWYRARVLCCHALIIFESINSEHGRAHTENHLGILYTRQGIGDRAREHLERACAIWQSMNDHHGLMRGLINLGLLYSDMECSGEALFVLDKALQQARLAGEEAEIGKIYVNMSLAHRKNRDLGQAEVYAWQADNILRRFSNSLDLALAWINLGLIYIEQRKWAKAEEHLEAAWQMSRELKNKYGEIETLLGMVEYQLARGNKQKAEMKLAELEGLVQMYSKGTRLNHLQSLLLQYRQQVT